MKKRILVKKRYALNDPTYFGYVSREYYDKLCGIFESDLKMFNHIKNIFDRMDKR